MINAAETQPPGLKMRAVNAGETIPPGSRGQADQDMTLQKGEMIADNYVIHERINKRGSQSDVYLAKKEGKSFAAKLYCGGWKPVEQVQKFLSNTSHPNIAHVVRYGSYAGHHYEIYEYYPEGTLEAVGSLNSMQIQKDIVPSINEGLHELHKNGIIHCDIKPGNLFYSSNKKQIVIGDFGTSVCTNTAGSVVVELRGTPEYAPRVKTLAGRMEISPAYDYGSFGLVLCRAVLGYSLFQGMSVEEISAAWKDGIELPGHMERKFIRLITGLINENEGQRWGYDEVKSWCDGEFIRSDRSLYQVRKRNPKSPMIFGTFEGKTISVSSLHQLAQAIREHWSHAADIMIRRTDWIRFVSQFDRSVYDKIKKLTRYHDKDAAVYKLLMYIEGVQQTICYCGKEYGSLVEYVEQLSTGEDETAKKFLLSGLLIFYLRQNDYEGALVDQLEKLIERQGCEDMTSISTICFALQGKRSINVFGEPVETLDDLVLVLREHSMTEINDLLSDSRFIAWMNRLGFEKEMCRMKEEFD